MPIRCARTRLTLTAVLLWLAMLNAAAFSGALDIDIGTLELPSGLRLAGIRASCGDLEFGAEGLGCAEGRLHIAESPVGALAIPATLQWSPTADTLELSSHAARLAAGTVDLRLLRQGTVWQLTMTLRGLDAKRLTALAATHWAGLTTQQVSSGRVDAELTCAGDGAVLTHCALSGELRGLNVQGINVAEAARLGFEADYRQDKGVQRIRVGAALRAGTVYVEPGLTLQGMNPGFLLQVTDTPITFALVFTRDAEGALRLTRATVHHAGVLALDLQGDVALAPKLGWSTLALELTTPDMKQLYQTYAQPLVLGTLLGALDTAGRLRITARGLQDKLTDLNLRFSGLQLDDQQRRFALYDLNGEVALHGGSAPLASRLQWEGASLYRIELGAGRIDWVSKNQRLRAVAWQDVGLFDGSVHFDTLELSALGSEGVRVELSGSLTPTSLTAITKAFGWPPLTGQLAGMIPKLTYEHGLVRVDGDLEVKAFDGGVTIRGLEIRDLFSAVPSLHAEVELRGLDLESLTRTFSFGNIQGRLDGSIHGLQLEAWQPVAFDAFFATPPDDVTRHRISRQAVDNLSSLGAGASSPLSQGWLSLIPFYSYGRLGIGCELAEGFCTMQGVAPAANGSFYILTRGGLLPPWIDIKGRGRRIAWQTLVDGIKQIASGEVRFDISAGRSRGGAPAPGAYDDDER